jgi:hypothetical protein
VLGSESIQYGSFGLLQFRDGGSRRETDRIGLRLWRHRKRLLLAASVVLYSRDIAAESPVEAEGFFLQEGRSGIIEANVLYHSLIGLAIVGRFL